MSRFGRRALGTMAITMSAVALVTGCYTQGETTCAQESNPRATLRGRVVDATNDQPIEGSIVAVELCGIYTRNIDPSKAHPNYLYGALTQADGTFSVDVPGGKVGLHTFKDGYRYGFVEVADVAATPALVRAQPLLAADRRPVVSNVRVEPPTAAPGARVTVTAQVVAGTPRDPLSEEVIVYEPRSNVLRAMAPPSRGVPGKAYPNGAWTATLKAPTSPGEYDFQVVVSSEQCVTSDRTSARLVVR